MRRINILLCCVLTTFSCDPDEDERCRIETSVNLADGPLTIISKVELIQLASGMVMAGLDADNNTARWAPITFEGKLGTTQSFMVPPRIAGPWFAVSGKGGSGNQLVAVYAAPNPADATKTQVLAVAQGAGDTATAPVLLFETEPGSDPTQLIVAVGTSSSGMRAGVAIGFKNQPNAPITVMVLGPDAQKVGGNHQLGGVPVSWRCLRFFSSTRSPIGLSLYDPTVTPNQDPVGYIYELQDDGSNPFTGKPTLLITANAECPIIASGGPLDYLVGWNTPDSASVADYHLGMGTENGSVTTENLGGTITFKGAIPIIAAIAPVNGSFSVAFGATGKNMGPQVRLYDFQGTRTGDPLLLPLEQGNAGPLAGASQGGALFVSYREGANLTVGSGPRRFVKVACSQ